MGHLRVKSQRRSRGWSWAGWKTRRRRVKIVQHLGTVKQEWQAENLGCALNGYTIYCGRSLSLPETEWAVLCSSHLPRNSHSATSIPTVSLNICFIERRLSHQRAASNSSSAAPERRTSTCAGKTRRKI